MAKTCTNCKAAAAKRNGLCPACGMYQRRHGIPRPEHLIVTHGRRTLERQLENRNHPY